MTLAAPNTPSAPSAPAARLFGITKRFGDLVAVDRADFSVNPGEIHALIGENGAGKSTLMNVLAGVYAPDDGAIELFGKPVRFRSPRDAIRAGVGMVHQHFAQAPSLTVAQNLVLADPDAPFRFDPRKAAERVRALGDKFLIRLDPSAVAGDLSVGEQQRLELLRLLAKDARVLILDEPTAVYTPNEAQELFGTLKCLAEAGCAIIYITHKLDEVEACADRISVLRRGRSAASGVHTSRCSRAQIASLMVGESLREKETYTIGKQADTVCILNGVHARSRIGVPALCGVDLRLHAGEILAVAGVAGNGQRELAEAILGMRPYSGFIGMLGYDLSRCSTGRIRGLGAGFVPEDRMTHGICGGLGLADNLNLDLFGGRGAFFPDEAELDKRAENLARGMKISSQNMSDPIRNLSGGNVQRAILAREMDAAKKLLVVSQPTRGLDIAATAAVRAQLVRKRDAGCAVLLISYDLDEIFEIADRVVVMFRGRIAARFDRPLPDRGVIGLAMAGGG